MRVFTAGRQGTAAPPDADTPAIILIRTAELEADAAALGMEAILLPPLDESAANRFESREGYDCLLLNIPDKTEDIEAPPVNIDIYHSQKRLIFVHDPSPAIDGFADRLPRADLPPFGMALYAFFNLLTENDAAYLEEVEASIAALEDRIMDGDKANFTPEISTLRKKLIKQKRYFESLVDALEDMEENENKLFDKRHLHFLHIITNRADRQAYAVLNLRDYVTQVREAYQAQIDIELNKTMKLFTVITVIFLPLTLLVGWYGMNLKMPETAWAGTYPAVIAVSVAIVVGIAVYFRKKKWF